MNGEELRVTRLGPRWVEEDAGHETPCWRWLLFVDEDGYGKVTVIVDGRKTTTTAQRFTYEALVGGVPEGWTLDHQCDNRFCCNPEHVEAVPHAINVKRSRVVKLTTELAAGIRSRRGHQSGPKTAVEFGVGTSTVYDIWNQRRWAA